MVQNRDARGLTKQRATVSVSVGETGLVKTLVSGGSTSQECNPNQNFRQSINYSSRVV